MSSSIVSETKRAANNKAYQGRRLLNAGAFEAAILVCSEAIELDSISPGPRRTRAEANKRLGRVTKAEGGLKILGDRSPIDDLNISVIDDAWANEPPLSSETQSAAVNKTWEGARLLSSGDYEGAIVAITEAIKLDPSSLGARRTRAHALIRLGRESEAAHDLNFLRRFESAAGDPRPALYSRLGQFGARARPPVRGKSGGSGGDVWRIDVLEGPIRRVTITNQCERAASEFDHDRFVRQINYLVPDSRIGPQFPGKDVQYIAVFSEEGTDVLTEFEGRFIFRVDTARSCWVLTEGAWEEDEVRHWTDLLPSARQPDLPTAVAKHAPSRLQWDGYQAFARQVLAAPTLVAYLMDHHPIHPACDALHKLGVTASVMQQDPFTKEPPEKFVKGGVPARVMAGDKLAEYPPVKWISIADGPICWVELGRGTLKSGNKAAFLSANSAGMGFGVRCYVPDVRLAPDSAQMRMVSNRVRSFPPFGPVKAVLWQSGSLPRSDIAGSGQAQKDSDFSLRISEFLDQDLAAKAAIKSGGTDICVLTDPITGCWVLAADDRPTTKWTKALWDCCQTIAESLLAMPLPKVG